MDKLSNIACARSTAMGKEYSRVLLYIQYNIILYKLQYTTVYFQYNLITVQPGFCSNVLAKGPLSI